MHTNSQREDQADRESPPLIPLSGIRARGRPWLTVMCERLLEMAPARPAGATLAPVQPARRVLLVKVHGMGDAILVRSLLGHLMERNPAMEVGVLAGPATREVMSMGASYRIHEYDPAHLGLRSALRTLRQLRSRRYDALLNFEQGSLAGTAFLSLSRIPIRVGFGLGHSKAAFLSHQIEFQPGDSMWRSFTRLAQVIDPRIPDSFAMTPLPIEHRVRQRAELWLEEKVAGRDGPLIAMHLGAGAGQPFKRWPLQRFVDLARRLRASSRKPLTIILTGQAFEVPLIREFMNRYEGCAVDGSELGSIAMTAAVLSGCDLLVSNDTGVMHLGAAMGTPTVGLFGATAPACWAPLGRRATFIYDTQVSCSPCVNSYRNRVPLSCANPRGNLCMLDIEVASVVEAARHVIVGGWLS